MEALENGQRYLTFTYTERASVAIFNLNNYTITAPLRNRYGTITDLVRGLVRPWHIYIDVTFSLPSAAPYLDIRVHRLPIV